MDSQFNAQAATALPERRMVLARLRAVNEPLMLARGEEKAALGRILELLEQNVSELRGELERLERKLLLQELELRRDQEGIVVEVCIEVGPAVLVGRREAPIAPHRGADELERAPRQADPGAVAENAAGMRHATDRERVPRNEDLSSRPG